MIYTIHYVLFPQCLHCQPISCSWLSCRRPVSFCALSALKLALIFENVSSMGLNSG